MGVWQTFAKATGGGGVTKNQNSKYYKISQRGEGVYHTQKIEQLYVYGLSPSFVPTRPSVGIIDWSQCSANEIDTNGANIYQVQKY